MPTVTKSTVITSSTVPSNAMPLQIGVTPALWLDGADASTLLSDGAASFTAASVPNVQYLSKTSNSSLQTGDVDFWYAGWFYINDTASYGLWSKYANSGSVDIRIIASGAASYTVSVSHSTGAGQVFSFNASGTYSVANWTFLFIYHNKTNKTIYASLGNNSFSSYTYTGTLITSNASLILGTANDSLSSPLNGRLDSVSFGKPSSGWLASKATELRDYLYNGGAGRRSSDFINYYLYSDSGAVSWWDLDEVPVTATTLTERKDRIGTNHLTDNKYVGYVSSTVCGGLVQYNGDPIKQWSDKSGNNRHLLAPSDAARPTYKTSQQNGRSAVLFDGTDDRVQLADASAIKALDNVTVFGVVKPTAAAAADTTTAGGILYLHNSDASQIWFTGAMIATSLLSGEKFLAYGDSTGASERLGSSTYSRSANTTEILSGTLGSSGVSFWQNGQAINLNLSINTTTTTASGPSQTTITSPLLSHPSPNGSTTEQRTMELIVYPTTLSTSQRQRIERYLAEKWMSPPTVTLITSSSSQYLEWAAVDMAGSYKVYYRVNGTTAWTLALTTTSLYAVITGLTVGTAYDFRVDAVWSV